jgi:hypothetical protein
VWRKAGTHEHANVILIPRGFVAAWKSLQTEVPSSERGHLIGSRKIDEDQTRGA